ISPPGDLTTGRSHRRAISPPGDLTTGQSHRRAISPPGDLTTTRQTRPDVNVRAKKAKAVGLRPQPGRASYF
ncbi:MAG: hypothetical protein KJ063_20010, partial [Anaerolineae bacterium]|nr:hypothetical protein [Anaerolineae bacterium]